MSKIDEDVYPFRSPGGLQGGVIASNSPIEFTGGNFVPTALITVLTGSGAMNTISLPWPGFTGMIIVVGGPSSAVTLVAGGTATGLDMPLAYGGSVGVGEAKALVTDGTQWYPLG